MIILFDCNCYDKLIELSDDSFDHIINRTTKVLMPQAVRKQLDMMLGCKDQIKIEKLSKINCLIARIDVKGRLEKVDGMFGFVSYDDVENSEIKEDIKIQRKYYSTVGFANYDAPYKKSLGTFASKKISYFKSLPNKMKNADKEIALTAKQENAIVITNDRDFLKGMDLINQQALSFEEFMKHVYSSDES